MHITVLVHGTSISTYTFIANVMRIAAWSELEFVRIRKPPRAAAIMSFT